MSFLHFLQIFVLHFVHFRLYKFICINHLLTNSHESGVSFADLSKSYCVLKLLISATFNQNFSPINNVLHTSTVKNCILINYTSRGPASLRFIHHCVSFCLLSDKHTLHFILWFKAPYCVLFEGIVVSRDPERQRMGLSASCRCNNCCYTTCSPTSRLILTLSES